MARWISYERPHGHKGTAYCLITAASEAEAVERLQQALVILKPGVPDEDRRLQVVATEVEELAEDNPRNQEPPANALNGLTFVGF